MHVWTMMHGNDISTHIHNGDIFNLLICYNYRVILRCPLVGRDFMTRSQYKQMIGRAGRSGLSESGESILIIHPQDKSKVS